MSETFTKVRYGLVGILLLFCAAVSAQTISGNVKDANGEPVIGATIMEQGTQNGTVTDFDGNFTLKLQKGGNINVSYVGMKSQVIKTAGKSSVNITLEDDNTTLSDLVVVGYGTIKKNDLTGSVGSVDTEKLNAKGAPSVMENLQGSTPGVNITMTGRVGDSPNIEIRGKSSLNSSTTPLFVVDGVFCDDIDWLNPQDIERIDVLKDASSTAIYGSRATAGVVMVTTKKGTSVAKDKKPTVSYDGYYGWVKAVRFPEFMNAQQFSDYRFQKFMSPATNNAYLNVSPANPIYLMTSANYSNAMMASAMLKDGIDQDWVDEITRGGSQQNHYLAVNGSSKTVSYNVGLGYNAEKGIYEGDESRKINFKGSLDAEINKYVSVGFTINGSHTKLSEANAEAIQEAYMMPSLVPAYNKDGSIAEYPGASEDYGMSYSGSNLTKTYNPLYKMKNVENATNTWRLLGNAYVNITPFKGFSFKSTYSPSYRNAKAGSYIGITNPDTGKYYDPDSEYNSYAYLRNTETFSWTWDNVVNYNTRIKEDHSIGIMGLYSAQRTYKEFMQMGASGVAEATRWNNLSTGTPISYSDNTNYGAYNYYTENRMSSWAMRLNYGYKDRYLLTATVRWDGSSKFAKDKRWGSFPSAAFAWRITEEPWMKKLDWLSNLKLRISYGVTGNCDGIDNYATLLSISDKVSYPYGNTLNYGSSLKAYVDQDLKWEKSHEWNFGLDFGFLNGRISGSVDYYNKTSKDLLYGVQLPLEMGGGTLVTNIGKVNNKGVEISLTGIAIDTKDWNWTLTGTFSHNKNTVKEINGQTNPDGSPADLPSSNLFIGHSINNVYGYDWCGIVTDRLMNLSDAQMNLYREKGGTLEAGSIHEYDYYYQVYGWTEGSAILADTNLDGKLNDSDKRIWSSDPSWTGSLTSNLSWKNWDFSFSLYTKQNYTVSSKFLGKYGVLDQRGQGRLKQDYYIPAGTLLSCDGVRENGTYINPVYQTSTHYGDYPIVTGSGAGGIGDTNVNWKDAMTYVDASFVKVKNITLGYTFPKKWLTPWGCSHLRLYFTVTNPFVFTKYKGFDPEWADASIKKDVPSTVTYQVGASIKF